MTKSRQTEKTLPFAMVDVFSDKPFAGNQLGVVFDADGLETDTMQSIASEFGYSETAFVVGPHSPEARYGLRIFTPRKELPFAGHPVIGAAYAMAATGRMTQRSAANGTQSSVIHLINDLPLGSLAVELLFTPGEHSGHSRKLPAKVAMEQGSPKVGEAMVDSLAAKIAAAVGLSPHEVLITPGPRISSTGLPCLVVPVSDEHVLNEASAQPVLSELLSSLGAELIYLFASSGDLDHYVARCFAPNLGIAEDPATGSAAGALGAYLHTVGVAHADGMRHLWIRQGGKMGRPSQIEIEVRDGSAGLTIWAGGACSLVVEGTVRI